MITTSSNEGMPEPPAGTTRSPFGAAGGKTRVVRYSLEEMLKEVEIERDASDMGREVIDQSEIKGLFNKNKKKKRAAN
ncbi:MAG: hypothetical protein ACFB20_10055 [Opitutales bacterium]